jgi:hypothetical protein
VLLLELRLLRGVVLLGGGAYLFRKTGSETSQGTIKLSIPEESHIYKYNHEGSKSFRKKHHSKKHYRKKTHSKKKK